MPKCTMCNADSPNPFGDHPTIIQPKGGLHLSIYSGYAMFTDVMDEELSKELTKICLCHDCSLKFIDMFPEDFKNIFTGGHPKSICQEQSHSQPQGCHYAW